MTTLFTLTFQGERHRRRPPLRARRRGKRHAGLPDVAAAGRGAPARLPRLQGRRPSRAAGCCSRRSRTGATSDGYDRPVLRATGCLLEAAEASGALRDPTAVWEALGDGDVAAGADAFERRVAALSIHTAPEAFALFRAELEHAGAFYARIADLLSEEPVDLYLEDAGLGPGTPAAGLRAAFLDPA